MLNVPDKDESNEDLSDIIGGMAIGDPDWSRGVEISTIEGSPMMLHRRKKVDQKLTPAPFRKENLHNIFCAPRDLNRRPQRTVLIVDSGNSTTHDTKEHQENKRRTEVLTGVDGCLRRDPLKDIVLWESGAVNEACITDILRVHEYAYFSHLNSKCSAENQRMPHFYAPTGNLDSDTPLSPGSLSASKTFCGAAILAVQKVLDQPNYDAHVVDVMVHEEGSCGCEIKTDNGLKSAFVVGRPPGHHAGPNGCVPSRHFWLRPDMASSGFCLLNTVAVAAAFARYNYSCRETFSDGQSEVTFVRGHSAETRPLRIAIVDIDIHHGNGTEDIVRNLKPRRTFLPLPSSWAPVSQLSYKPWLNEQDAQECLFCSINLFAEERFYPCSGGESEASCAEADDCNIINIALTPVGPGPWDGTGRMKLTAKQRQKFTEMASEEMRSKVTEMLLPRLSQFSPDLLFFSAGFDAHYDDMYHFLDEDDIDWLTRVVSRTAPKVVSVLEGGYSLSETPIRSSRKAKTSTPEESVSENSTVAHGKYGVLPGDGGLVRGVLAHVMALACDDHIDTK